MLNSPASFDHAQDRRPTLSPAAAESSRSAAAANPRPSLATPNTQDNSPAARLRRDGFAITPEQSSALGKKCAEVLIIVDAQVEDMKSEKNIAASYERSMKERAFQRQVMEAAITMLNGSIQASDINSSGDVFDPLGPIDYSNLKDPDGNPVAFNPTPYGTPAHQDHLWYTSRTSKEFLEQMFGFDWQGSSDTRGPSTGKHGHAADARIRQIRAWVSILQTMQSGLVNSDKQDAQQLNQISSQLNNSCSQAAAALDTFTRGQNAIYTGGE
ncbi:hypothetical protein QS306_09135 [Paraburkholderia bonniea]|uniref:hypothetical protein n=1 Tax=Paraburkholderia bonniea TaxID=2152891 RepID=UPI0012916FFD|nr:hypothetical protein [Paraburkholderia bonniea]WJF89286.1 hypothetical protein QS306_09135 [Paraburkholderia bonniea]WJF92602.1 hypothetical protein QS308_09145 [Paraburkholderia bonniea]